jgi:hypothetical protein
MTTFLGLKLIICALYLVLKGQQNMCLTFGVDSGASCSVLPYRGDCGTGRGYLSLCRSHGGDPTALFLES